MKNKEERKQEESRSWKVMEKEKEGRTQEENKKTEKKERKKKRKEKWKNDIQKPFRRGRNEKPNAYSGWIHVLLY